MPYYPDLSQAGVGLSGAAGATSIGFAGPGQSSSIDVNNALQVVISGGSQVAESTTIRGFGQTLNFAGSAVAGVSVASTTATITLNAGAVGTTITVAQTGTNVGDVLALNFVGLTGTISVASTTATIGLSAGGGAPVTDFSGAMVYVSGGQLKAASAVTGGVFYDETDNRLEISGTDASLAIYALTGSDSITPPVDAEGVLFMRRRAGRILPNFVGPNGVDWAFQPLVALNHSFLQQANGNATTYSTWGGAAATATGTATTANWSNTNFSSSLRRVDHPAGAASGGSCGIRGAAAFHSLGDTPGKGGFFFLSRFIVASTGTTNTMRLFSGFTTASANPTNLEPASMINCVGLVKNATDANYSFYSAGGSAGVKTDTGILVRQGDVIEHRVYCKPSGVWVGQSIEIIATGGTGSVGSGQVAETGTTGTPNTAQLPANTLGLNWTVYLQTTGTTAVRIGMVSVYTETDY